MFLSDAMPPADERALQQLEMTIGVRLPPDYRGFLQQFNGGTCQYRGLTVEHPDKGLVTLPFETMFGVEREQPDADLLNNYIYYCNSERIPRWFLPIAIDVGTNLVGIGLDSVRYGQVFFWDHEREFLAENGVFPLVPSFTTFVQSVRPLY
jgi:hypothetical protein